MKIKQQMDQLEQQLGPLEDLKDGRLLLWRLNLLVGENGLMGPIPILLALGKENGSTDELPPATADAICRYHINSAPSIEVITPNNGSTDISLQPTCQIWANDTDGDMLTVHWYENSTGPGWTLRNTNNSVSANSTVSYTFTEFSNYNTTYYWKVAVNDSEDDNSSWFYFTTLGLDPPTVVTNASTGVEEMNATLWGYLQDDGNATTTCGFWYDTSSGGTSNNVSVGIVSEGNTFNYSISGLTPGQLYYFKAWANNSAGFNGTANELTFLVKPNATVNLNAQTNSSSMIYLTWTAGDGANTTYIERNTSGDTVWARGTGTLVYNDTGTSCEDTGLSGGITYY